VKQESLFYWWEVDGKSQALPKHLVPMWAENKFSAFTGAELGEMLPTQVISIRKGFGCSYIEKVRD
jgi:hypothetical protein